MKKKIILLSIILSATIIHAQDKKIGMCLSGGGALGFAHVGVLKAFEEHNVNIDMISGASIGSIMGGLYAYGYKADDIMKLAKDKKINKLRSFAKLSLFSNTGLSNHKKLTKILDELLPVDTFEELKIPFAIAVTDISSLEGKIVSSGDNLKKYIMASSSIPIVFQPVEINGITYVDGGVTNHSPIEFLIQKNDIVIISECVVAGSSLDNLTRNHIVRRVMVSRNNSLNIYRLEQADYTIVIEGLENYNIMDFRSYLDIYAFGYKAGLKFLEQHPELYPSRAEN